MFEPLISFRQLSTDIANILKDNKELIDVIHDRDCSLAIPLDGSPLDDSEQDRRTLLNIIKTIEAQFDRTGWMSRDFT
jgi:hypothetical protein